MPSQPTLDSLRSQIRQAKHADEKSCVEKLLQASSLTDAQRERIVSKGRMLVAGCREDSD